MKHYKKYFCSGNITTLIIGYQLICPHRLVAFDPYCSDLGSHMAGAGGGERSPSRLVQLDHFHDCHPEAVLSRYRRIVQIWPKKYVLGCVLPLCTDL